MTENHSHSFIGTYRHGAVLELRLQRPEKKNALNQAMYRSLADGFRSADQHHEVAAVVLRGSEHCFTAGNDLADFASGALDADSPVLDFMRALSSFSKPLIVAVEGMAVGIGTTLLLHADLVAASADAQFSLPFSRLGLCPEFASSLLLPRLCGHVRAFEYLVLGEAFDAQQAYALGLINVVTDNPLDWALQRAQRLAAMPREAVRNGKALCKAPLRAPAAAAWQNELDIFAQALKGPEFAQAVAAFFNKSSKT